MFIAISIAMCIIYGIVGLVNKYCDVAVVCDLLLRYWLL